MNRTPPTRSQIKERRREMRRRMEERNPGFNRRRRISSMTSGLAASFGILGAILVVLFTICVAFAVTLFWVAVVAILLDFFGFFGVDVVPWF